MKKSLSIILGFTFIIGGGYVCWYIATSILKLFFESLKNLNQNQTTLLIALVPSTIAMLGIFISNNLQKSRDFAFKNREKKERAYDIFMKILYEFINQSRTGKTNDQLAPLVLKSRKELVLWGSDEVVKLHSEFMSISQETPDADPTKNERSNRKLEQMILAIRKDLGYKNSKLIPGDLLRFFR
jgi:hypothetical protein